MILCFSGTGNSRAVALLLADILGEEVTGISDSEPATVDLSGHKRLILCCPVHSWGLPKAVMRYLKKLTLTGAGLADIPQFLVMTCGDDAGLAHEQWRKVIRRRGWRPRCAHSVFMPNTYVTLPGFDVDSPELVEEKLATFPERVAEIAHAIKCNLPVDSVYKGRMAWFKTHIVYPLFMRFLTSPRPFNVDRSACISCGKCSRACPLANVTLTEGIPSWGKNCTLCLACYHVCPVKAIGYGRRTTRKGQYFFRSATAKDRTEDTGC